MQTTQNVRRCQSSPQQASHVIKGLRHARAESPGRAVLRAACFSPPRPLPNAATASLETHTTEWHGHGSARRGGTASGSETLLAGLTALVN